MEVVLPMPEGSSFDSMGPAQKGAYRKGFAARMEGEPRTAPTYDRSLAAIWIDAWDQADRGEQYPGHPDITVECKP